MRWVRTCAVAVTICLTSLLWGAVTEGANYQEAIPPGGTDADCDTYSDSDDESPTLWCEIREACHATCAAGLMFGVEGTFLGPIGEPEQTVTLTDLITERAYTGSPHASLGAGVRTWLGLQRCGRGIRFQYWHLGNDSVHAIPVAPIDGEPAFVESFYLRADAVDIEFIQRLSCFCDWTLDTSFGGRYARLERNSTVVGYGTLGNGVDLYGLATGGNEIEGAGLTFSFCGRKPIGCNGCWHTFWSYRGSFLWADSTVSALTEANAVTTDPLGAANSRDQAFLYRDNTEHMYISEIQLGVQYERSLRCFPTKLFLRAALEFQHWTTGDTLARTNSYAFLHDGPEEFGGRVDASSDAHDGDLDLLGFAFAMGLTY